MARSFNTFVLRKLLKIQVARYSQKKEHWAKEKKTAKYVALKHFDEFYNTVYKDNWPSIRKALLMEEHKYVAVVNSFSDIDRIKTELELQGAMNLKMIYRVYKEKFDETPYKLSKGKKGKNPIEDMEMETVIADTQMTSAQSDYSVNYASKPAAVSTVDENEDIVQECGRLQPVQMKSIEANMNKIKLDTNRIVYPKAGLSGLYEFVPATQIKGLEHWVLESEHYGYYNQSADFSVNTEPEAILTFPEYLNIYTFEKGNNSKFPAPKKGSTNVLDYYLLDGASVLPVLALDLQPGDSVLDMCAAPGGKTLTILQTLMPRLMVANDLKLSRVNRIHNIINQFLNGIGQWHERLYVTQKDARAIEDKDMFNKILVDVPCTTDRHVLHSNENNMFKSSRIQERLRIPELQANILTNALKMISVGGTVVYSTCSLSPIQNDGVVGIALKKAWEETNSIMIVKDMTRALEPLKCLYKFGDYELKYGHIVVPTINNNWGPMYFCKIVRVR